MLPKKLIIVFVLFMFLAGNKNMIYSPFLYKSLPGKIYEEFFPFLVIFRSKS
uniref:Hypothetical secreted protein n=1 Tax=Glossina morsitans morsitans TaxID=37546 RepID=D3TS13_GLOMM